MDGFTEHVITFGMALNGYSMSHVLAKMEYPKS